jgi:hypothetical protein
MGIRPARLAPRASELIEQRERARRKMHRLAGKMPTRPEKKIASARWLHE